MQGQPSHALLGQELEGGYRVDRLLGQGGMGAVYQGTHLRLGKPVAIKVMVREWAGNTEALARFHREAVVTGRLGDPHIVQVFDFNTMPTGEPFLVMEFLEGEDLEHRLRRVGRLSAPATVTIVGQVASALASAHAKGIVHRDLKPANVYLLKSDAQTDFVKVLDFGISKVRSASGKLTKTNALMGTPNYMSPEQALGRGAEIDERTDQWALACIAWECLCGEAPFGGDELPAILFQVVHQAPPDLGSMLKGLPGQVEAVLLQALSKDKTRRYASVSDFAAALASAVSGPAALSATAAVDRPPSSWPAPTPSDRVAHTTLTQTAGESLIPKVRPRPGRRHKWALGLTAAAILATGTFLGFRPGPAPRTMSSERPEGDATRGLSRPAPSVDRTERGPATPASMRAETPEPSDSVAPAAPGEPSEGPVAPMPEGPAAKTPRPKPRSPRKPEPMSPPNSRIAMPERNPSATPIPIVVPATAAPRPETTNGLPGGTKW